MFRLDVAPRHYRKKTNIILLINLHHRCLCTIFLFFFCQCGIGVMSPPLPSTHQVYLNNSENYEVRSCLKTKIFYRNWFFFPITIFRGVVNISLFLKNSLTDIHLLKSKIYIYIEV